MYRMKNNIPTRKVAGGALAAALTSLLIWLLERVFLPGILPDGIPAEIQGAILTVIVFLVGYYVPPAARDQIVALEQPANGKTAQ
ncbi:hypothetical protein [Aestuariivita sp.]|uniref:hypothetical protein n=1 Tax=Aestuariivita sp. TaxID=1872407 RepID=UPI00216F2306|nr:hypothetical protein [Aestuariivita sp.]MCE8005935.1 hypothetical protein [Aestuariivita sp.]